MNSKQYNFLVSENFAGGRLDIFLTSNLTGTTRARIQKLIREGNVLLNKSKAKASQLVKKGDSVDVDIPPPVIHQAVGEDIPLNIIYEDKDIVVVNKGADMVVHPAAGNWSGTLVNALLSHCKDLSGIGGELKPGIVHRLDKGTSGVIVAAKNDRAHLCLSRQFQKRKVKKIYNALVYGNLKEDSGVIESAIGRSVKDRKRFSSRTNKGRNAVTEWKVLNHFECGVSFVEVRLHTGRTHQIRVHFAEAGHPLVGDIVYGGRKQSKQISFPRPALHARKLGFIHPTKGEWMEFEAPLAEDIELLMESLCSTNH